MKQQTHITVTNPEFYDVLKEDAQAGETNWTINRHARRGDTVLLYVTAPVSAVVARAIMAEDAQRDDDPSSEWFGSYLADMHSLKMLEKPITRQMLLDSCSSWGWPRQPRNSVRVPPEFVPLLLGF